MLNPASWPRRFPVADAAGETIFGASGNVKFLDGNVIGDISLYTRGVGSANFKIAATERADGAGEIDVSLGVHDLGVSLDGAAAQFKAMVGYAPGAYST